MAILFRDLLTFTTAPMALPAVAWRRRRDVRRWPSPKLYIPSTLNTDYGGFHLHLLMFPFVDQFNSKIEIFDKRYACSHRLMFIICK